MAAGLHILSRDVMWEYMNEVEDKFLFDEIFVRHEYLKNGIIISDGDTILDIGANIGMFSIYASCQASNLHIVAVEPIPPIFEVLSRNLQHCQLTCEDFSFTSISCAISSRDSASEKLTFYPEAPGESTRNVDERTSQHEKLVTCASVCDVEEIRQQSISKRESHLSLEYNIGTRTLKSLISEHSVKKVDLLKVIMKAFPSFIDIFSLGCLSRLMWKGMNWM